MKIKLLQRSLKESRYTLREIAANTGISVSTLVDWQTGRSPRDLDKLRRLSHFLGHSFHEMCFGEPDPMEARVAQEWLISQIEGGKFEIVLRLNQKKF